MSVESALLGTPRVIALAGIDHEVGLITGKVRAEYEQRLVARAVDKLKKNRALYGSKKEYLLELRILGEREDRGEFAFNSNLATLATSWGQEMLMKLLMPQCPADVLQRILDEMSDEVNWVIERVIRESMPITSKKAEDTDPFVPEGAA